MPHKDKYVDFHELAAYEREDINGKCDYRILVIDENRLKDIVVLAPHGGGIEPHTSDIAKKIAGDKYSLYLFEGTKKNCNFSTLHITSTNFNEPKCLEILKKAKTAIAIHGKGGAGEEIFVGGKDQELAQKVTDGLLQLGFNASKISKGRLSGTSDQNICNKTSTDKGVQLEIEKGLRNKLIVDSDLFDNFVLGVIKNL